MRHKYLIRVELNRERGGSVHLSASLSDRVSSIKQKLEAITGIPTPSQTLYHATTPLTDTDTLRHFSDTFPVTTLYLHILVRGGACRQNTGFQPFLFKDVTSEDCFEKNRLAGIGKHYLTIYKGLSFQAKCANWLCESVRAGSCVYISKGMYADQGGYVSIRREVFRLKCPACNVAIPAENWQNIVFTDCTASIEWILVDNREGTTTIVTEKGMYTRAKPNVAILEYHTLDVKLK